MSENIYTWIDVEQELPPCDGFYEVTNNNKELYGQGVAYYDGIGFKAGLVYNPPCFWRALAELKKTYGKT